MTSPSSIDLLAFEFDPKPAEGLEEVEILPFTKFRKAITDRLKVIDVGEDTQQWMVFSDFDSLKLKYIDQRRYPIRIQVDGDTLVIKMVHPVHEAMHTNLLGYIEDDMKNIGLRRMRDFIYIGSARFEHCSGKSSKADGSIAPMPSQWPALIIEAAGWSESVARLRIDAQWWLSAQLPPVNTTLVILISFKRSERTFYLEKYEIVSTTTVVTRSAPLGNVTVDLRTTPPTIAGAPFILPFTGIMRRPPTAAERDISLSAADLESWATGIAVVWNL